MFRYLEQMVPTIKPQEVREKAKDFQIIDVRRPEEFIGELGHIAGAKLVTLETDLQHFLPTLPKDGAYVFVCRSGARSAAATQLAIDQGLAQSFNMSGGMLAWNALEFEIERT